MHFSIPDSSEIQEEGSSGSYQVYNIFVNGSFHSAVRFRELYQFHEQLKKEFGPQLSVKFPPKKILSLTPPQVEERRTLLEGYLQHISQDPDIVGCGTFVRFLLNAQKGFHREESCDVNINVHLMSGHKITLSVLSTDSSDDILEAALVDINLPERLIHYFSLYLVKKNEQGAACIVRSLESFECPYLCLKLLKEPHKLVIRKNYWDVNIDSELMEDKVARDLLFIQAVSDVEKGWVLLSQENHNKLEQLKREGAKMEYLHLAQTLRFYGFIQFKLCKTNYPVDNTTVLVSIGGRELNFRIQNNEKIQEGNFKVTRMRCWRITSGNCDEDENPQSMELSFEYLFTKSKMEWITIYSEEAIFMSLCLQSIVDEIIRQREGKPIKQPSSRPKTKQTKPLDSLTASTQNDEPDGGLGNKDESTMKKISKHFSEKVHSLKREKGQTNTVATVENELFSGIGDDDL